MKKIKIKIIVVLAIFGLIPLLYSATSLAAGDAYYSLSTPTSSYNVGSSFTINVSETSTTADSVQGVQANLSYNSSLLKFNSLSISGSPFTLCAQQTGGSGQVQVGCASSPNPVSGGTYPVVQVNFSVIATGATSVAIASSSNIENSSEVSVWNGSLSSVSLNLVNPPSPAATSTPKPTTTSTTTTSSRVSSTSVSTTQTVTPKPSVIAPTTTTITPTNNPVTSAESPPLGNLSVKVTNSQGQPISNAKVVLNNLLTRFTNSAGIALFTNIHTGTNQVVVSAPGNQNSSTTVMVVSGKTTPVSFNLTASSSPLTLIGIISLITIVLLLGVAWRVRGKNKSQPQPSIQPQTFNQPPVSATNVGRVFSPTTPSLTTPINPITPAQPTNNVSQPQPSIQPQIINRAPIRPNTKIASPLNWSPIKGTT